MEICGIVLVTGAGMPLSLPLTGTLFDRPSTDEEQAFLMMNAYHEMGGNFIDT